MCDFEKRLVAYLDKELPDNEAAEIGRHLEDCAECRALAAQFARTSAQFATSTLRPLASETSACPSDSGMPAPSNVSPTSLTPSA